MHIALLTADDQLAAFMEELFQGLPGYTLHRQVDEHTQVVIQEPEVALPPGCPVNTPMITLGAAPSHVGLRLVQPFKARDLLTMLQALENQKFRPWVMGDVLFSPLHKSVSVRDKIIYLTQIETSLLDALCHHAGVLSSQFLQESVLGYAPQAQTHSVETHFYRLRKKLGLIEVEDLIVFQDAGYCLSQEAHPQ